MPSPLSVFADVMEILDNALQNGGALIECASYGKAIKLRQRMNQLRIRDREENAEIYPPGHPSHGRSVYDSLTFRMAHNSNQILIEPRDFGELKITYGPPRKAEEDPNHPKIEEESK